MKCHQRIIRDAKSYQDPKSIASLESARVIPIDFSTAKSVILEYEWLGNMGTTQKAFGLYVDNELQGVSCFGRTAGTNVFASVCGPEYKDVAITLCRGACVHWAHPHAASFLISRACKLVRESGYRIVIAYSDPDAGEIGTVYQACNWIYCGMTAASEKFDIGDGKIRDSRLVHAYTRDRTGGTLKYKRTRAEQKALMIANGVRFFKGNRKHRYVHLMGSKKEIREMQSKLRWPRASYPKREGTKDHLTSLDNRT